MVKKLIKSKKKNKKQFIFQLSPLSATIDAGWYVINTYSGHEYKVIEALKTRIKTMGLEDQIFQAIVPIQSKMVIRRGKKIKTQEKTLPGYVIIQMTVTDDSPVLSVSTTNPLPSPKKKLIILSKKSKRTNPNIRLLSPSEKLSKSLPVLLLILSAPSTPSTRKKVKLEFSSLSSNAKPPSKSIFSKSAKNFSVIIPLLFPMAGQPGFT
ncbi:MAG: Transcription antitermination protein nusG [Candidatus Shapirobacteria bacterium GW2011_GWE1_38_92]|uniref:Transcription antitermination protein nusG n=1 Tax=Candidatus Shapirobacteria bacterium GW2011_GWE1_38_92 TaxID=1618489 RepID=A0A0G0LG18_9BACT|nr:MAG: Transcription antitermination protein nusG [Candidatus Shapirobacteria bacterium GW2011_GWE1_38_92]